MSIGIYAFLRIYFFGFGLSAFAQFRTHCASSPAFGRRSALALVRSVFWHGLPCCLSCAVVPGALGLVSPPLGYIGRTGGGVVDTSRRKNSKKAFFGVRAANTHPTFTNQNPSDCASLQKFRKIQKDPFRSLDCGIIS